MSREEKQNSLQELREIRSIMERSARFLSLSGWSGVWAGCTALIGAGAAWIRLQSYYLEYGQRGVFSGEAFIALRNQMAALAVFVLLVALSGGYFFTLKKIKKQGGAIWNNASRNMVFNLLLPLAAGGIFVVGLLYHNDWTYIAPACMIFYGLALVNASKYTISDIRYLGCFEILLGSLNLFLPKYGLIIWAAGFGILHILYGIIMWNKYDKDPAR